MAHAELHPTPDPEKHRRPLRIHEPPPPRRPWRRRALSNAGLGFLMIVALVAILWIPASMVLDVQVRRSIERGMNRSLTGYRVHLPHAHFEIYGFSVTLTGLTVRQEAHPDKPVAFFPRLTASVQWLELLRGHVVGNMTLDRPQVYVNLLELRKEVNDPVPVSQRGWQEAISQIYPLKINELKVNDGEVTYVDIDPKWPLRLTHLFITANNIRNIHSQDREYPSPIRAHATVFETGEATLDGHADFLAEPTPGMHAMVALKRLPLEHIRAVASRTNLVIRGGTLDTAGEIELSHQLKFAHFKDLLVSGMRLDYVHSAATAALEKRHNDAIERTAKNVTNKPGLVLKLDRLKLTRCTLGWVDRTTTPPYRAFLSSVEATITDLSNQNKEGTAVARIHGRFMGSGPTSLDARFRPETNGSDFDAKLAIESTDMTRMNDVLRAFGKFDVAEGVFAFYSQVAVKNGRVEGWIKPMFRDLKVYDSNQDRNKSEFHKLYERAVGLAAKLLTNHRTDKIATVAVTEGPVGSARASNLQIITGLIKNAFFNAVLPGFDRSLPGGMGSKKKDRKK